MEKPIPLGNPPKSIRVVSHNCWGLKYLAKYRNERLAEIGAQLAKAEPAPEIVGLQECWTQEDYQCIRSHTKHILPYGKFYYSGIFGGGLAILSKWPIIESNMYRYPLNGRPTAFFRGDWYVGKGVACAQIRVGSRPKDIVEVFCTHLHAPYEKEPRDSYICHRTAQAWEIAKLMRAAVQRGHLVVGVGDFNMIPSSLAHCLIESYGEVQDVWRILHPDSSLSAAEDAIEVSDSKGIPTIDFNLAVNGTTCDSASNTWRWNKSQQERLEKGEIMEVEGNTPDPKAKRLDYIFVGGYLGDEAWVPETVNVGMTERHPELHCSLSDHFSVEATLVHRGGDKLEAGTAESPVALVTRPSPNYREILAMVAKYELRERRQRRLRLGHFVASILVSIGCLAAIWWSPRNYVSFLLMLLSTLGLSAGVIDGLIGGLFVGSELRALKEFQWEMENARNLAVAEA